jgi:hypothetical protein
MKITFDSNVWRKISSPEQFPNDTSYKDFKNIRKAIDEKRIIPFLCETVFTLEAIERKNRQDFFSSYKPVRNISQELEGDQIKLSISIEPNKSAHPGNNSYLESHLQDAVAIGFQIIKLPRVAGVVNPDIEQYFYKYEDLGAYQSKAFEIARKIESKGAGFYHVKELGEKYNDDWVTGIRQAPKSEEGNIATAVAEWADGDSVACHIAVGGDYFCTRDTAKKAGGKSIFSQKNLEWLKMDYDFHVISPEELAQKIQNLP